MAVSADQGWPLAVLLDGFADRPVADRRVIGGLCLDSRACRPGDLFVAIPGARQHGIASLDDALANGAVAALYDPDGCPDPGRRDVPMIPARDLRRRVGLLADRFYGEPSRQLTVTGVTGTNGKTSVCHLIAASLDGPAARCALIGTVGNGPVDALEPSACTTPDAVRLHGLLAGFVRSGMRRVVIEVSSHALDQQRVGGLRFDTAVFTNLTHEHLDYHGDIDAYSQAKRRLFSSSGLRVAVLNVDDPTGRAWASELRDRLQVSGYGFTPTADVRGYDLLLSGDGIAFQVDTPLGRGRLASPLLGRFNASNLLAALATLLAAGLELDAALAGLARFAGVPGRMERFGGDDRPLAIVDYAHTPDALASVLAALRDHCPRRLWCVFGCGGDRDRAKRPLMGAIAEQHADRVIVTDDNPRGEDGESIVRSIVGGTRLPGAVTVIRDRAEAIGHALAEAGPGDIVLVAGKGHERVQQVGDRALPFDDRELVKRLLEVPR